MSGYRALRVAEGDDSTHAVGGSSAWYGGQADPPMVLARVADFRPASDEPSDDAFGETPGPRDDAPASEGEPHWLAAAGAQKSRLVVAGLILAAGLFGFGLGRWTSPDPPEDPQAWSPNAPAPFAPESPTWNSQGLTTAKPPAAGPLKSPGFSPTTRGSQSAAGSDGFEPGPWGPPPVAAPAESEKTSGPTLGQSPPTDVDGTPHWTANQGMTLPGAGLAGQPVEGRRVESDPYAAARVAQRPSPPVGPSGSPVQSPAPPNMQRSWPPGVQHDTRPPAEPNGQWPGRVPQESRSREYSTFGAGPVVDRGGSPAPASYGPVQDRGYSNVTYPSTGYPNVAYPSAPAQTNQAPAR